MMGIDMAFWIGMGVVTAIVIVGCAVAWGLPPKKIKNSGNKASLR